MEELMVLTYAAICYAVFKIFRIPVNQWTLATAALGGIFLIAMILLGMNYNHPYTKEARTYFSVTPILPGVSGRVIEVPVEANQPLKDGDVLFRLDPKPYQDILNEKKAQLATAEQNVKELQAQLDKATAHTAEVQAQVDLAQANYLRQLDLFQKQVIAQAELDVYTRNLDSAKQALAEARAEEQGAQLALSTNVNGVNTQVAQLRAEVDAAQYNLDQTVTRAMGPGFVTQVALRPGMYVVPIPLRPAMVFINTSERDRALGAWFRQNSLQRVHPGDQAEVAFDAVPGRVFQAKVRILQDAIAGGQIQPTGTLLDFATTQPNGRALAIIDVTDDLSNYQIPPGSEAQVAVYTNHLATLSLIRKVLLRMMSWKNYVFMESH
jgi:multidrug resistance efflux pump